MLAYDGSICCHLSLDLIFNKYRTSVSTGSSASWRRLPTMLTLIVQVKAFFVISQIYFLDIWVFSIEVANCTVAVDAQVQLLCYPRGSFYPISPVPPTKYTRITRSDFRLCLTCVSHSQASLCPCTIIPISIRN